MAGFRNKGREAAAGRRGFTLVELLVIVAILCAMAGVGVVSVRGGQAAARVKGATRDVFAAIRHARSQALVSQKPVVVTYSTEEADGEPVAKVEMSSADLFSSPIDRSGVQAFTGPSVGIRLAEAERSRARRRRSSGSTAESPSDGPAASDADDESLLHDVLFAPIREEVVRGMRLKVVMGDDEVDRPTFVSPYSNVDYLLRKYNESRGAASGTATEAEDGGADGTDGKKAPAERQEPVSVVWETNGRVEAHRVWVYADGQRPEDGLSIRIDRFGAAKVIPGDGREDDD